MNPLAQELNEKIRAEAPALLEMLSRLGQRIYFPSKGILSQSAEAKKLAGKYNATIGVALEGKEAMHLPCVAEAIQGVPLNDALLYAPSYGKPALRKAWWQKLLHDNPALGGIPCSLPVVTNGLTHAISLAGDLFLNPGEPLIVPDMNWDNYLLNFIDRLDAQMRFYPCFANGRFNLDGLRQQLDALAPGEKAMAILNFPNNPSGYTPLECEGEAIAKALLATAERGVRLVVLVDDAYYGLFYDEGCMKQSLFCKIAARHPNLLAIKADAATKECYVWGLRVGFLTYAVAGAKDGSPVYEALAAKTAGLIRATVSNCSALSQQVVLHALERPEVFYAQRAEKAALMRRRYEAVVRTFAEHPEYQEHFTPYPFNSGYFMCIQLRTAKTEELRRILLDKFQTGGIAITERNFRLAFSSLGEEQVPGLFDTIYQACNELAGKK